MRILSQTNDIKGYHGTIGTPTNMYDYRGEQLFIGDVICLTTFGVDGKKAYDFGEVKKKMTNGLVKERMTYFCDNGIAYQAFNTIFNRAKVLVYVHIDHTFVCCAEINVDHKINEEELKCIAIEREAMIALEN